MKLVKLMVTQTYLERLKLSKALICFSFILTNRGFKALKHSFTLLDYSVDAYMLSLHKKKNDTVRYYLVHVIDDHNGIFSRNKAILLKIVYTFLLNHFKLLSW